MNMKIDVNQIGYYKYKSKNNPKIDYINEYPIHSDIINYVLKNPELIEIEYQNSEPKKINNKFVVLI